MIQAEHKRAYGFLLDVYIGWRMRCLFHSHHITGDMADPGGSILLIGNHISWWDGFWARRVNQQTYQRNLYVMMLEDQLKSRRFLSKVGAFSIRKNHRDALQSLNYATQLLAHKENLVVLYPQGEFQSLHQHPVHFAKGWFRVLQQSPPHTKLVFMANLIDYFEHPKPLLTTWLHVARETFSDAASVESAYNHFLKNCIDNQITFHRADP